MFLLAGDAILNESMLTGESIPVSKVPVKDEELVRWKDGKGESPRSFIYGGTKVVRIRASMTSDGTQGRPALALVARTGQLKHWHELQPLTYKQASIQLKAHSFDQCCSLNQ